MIWNNNIWEKNKEEESLVGRVSFLWKEKDEKVMYFWINLIFLLLLLFLNILGFYVFFLNWFFKGKI